MNTVSNVVFTLSDKRFSVSAPKNTDCTNECKQIGRGYFWDNDNKIWTYPIGWLDQVKAIYMGYFGEIEIIRDSEKQTSNPTSNPTINELIDSQKNYIASFSDLNNQLLHEFSEQINERDIQIENCKKTILRLQSEIDRMYSVNFELKNQNEFLRDKNKRKNPDIEETQVRENLTLDEIHNEVKKGNVISLNNLAREVNKPENKNTVVGKPKQQSAKPSNPFDVF